MLHDIGKIDELNYARSFSYSTPGQLLGHIVIGVQMIEEKLRGLNDFPPKLRMLLEHMVLGHHGQIEFGSPKLPVFLEALLLAQIDNLDSKMATMLSSLERDRDPGAEWAGYNPALERQVLDKTTFLNERPAAAPTLATSTPSRAPSGSQPRVRQATAIGSALLAALSDKPGVR
jgi:3'-5' exoribonuclease